MNARLQKRLDGAGDDGFTLIELLIVIVILGILAAIVVFAIGGTRGDAVSSACESDVSSVQLAADSYKTKKGKFPLAGTQLTETSADKGLLKEHPITQSDYALTYSPLPAGVTAAANVTGYTITIGNGTSGNRNVTGTSIASTDNRAAIKAACLGT